jgi:hypothetical protein
MWHKGRPEREGIHIPATELLLRTFGVENLYEKKCLTEGTHIEAVSCNAPLFLGPLYVGFSLS